ncbi:hypothetical protein KC340_g8081 [Hortaea werneckii]|nr:hypothetical protein KC342_g14112 [Hortaea werneckii]KAI7096316.1 hypothetical protein KC339_g10461 [Hortaea werneckii]KAI7234117.1 hypothetical protein KC365_g6091 [Hortaea werneckii]KAI7318508.1 hypothetical protein KC340_g8081 [Hortaea werneckii]KAI7380946.1 hypothetical protein KC328_g12516 [Hortaea werneckii]
MCLQDFYHYACGHSKIFDTKCDEATQLEVAYWQKHACPHYGHRTFYPLYLCGAARFYCDHSPDAPFLNHTFQIRVASEDTVKKLGPQLTVAYNNVEKFLQHAKGLQIPSLQWPSIPVHGQIKSTVVALEPKVKEAQQHYREATAILEQAQKYFAQLAQQPGNNTSNPIPPFAPGPNALNKVPAEVQEPSFRERKDSVEDSNAKDAHNLATKPEDLAAMGSSQKQTSAQPSSDRTLSHQTELPPMEASGHKHRPLTYEEEHEVAMNAARRDEAKAKKRVAVEEETSPMKPKKKARSAKKAKPSQVQASESEAIRRSVRVRDRKIDYAESPGSEDPSSFKSEASGFSAETSEAGSSPKKAKQKRIKAENMAAATQESTAVPRSSFLGAKISDFQRRGGVAAEVASRQQNTTNPESMIRFESPKSSPSPSRLADSPEFRSVRAPYGLSRPQIQPSKMLSSTSFVPAGPWQPPSMRHRPQPFTPAYASSPIMGHPRLPSEYPTMQNVYSSYSDSQYHQYTPACFQRQPAQGPSHSQYSMPQSLAGGSSVGTGHYGTPPVLENRMPPLSFNQPSVQGYRRDSPVFQSQGNNFHAPMPNQYDSMRHSFNTNVPDLTPSNVFADSTSYGEPKKGKLPVTSPMFPNNEHMQLPQPTDSYFGNAEPEQPYDFGLPTQPASFGIPQMPEYGTTSTAGTQPFVNMRDLVASPSTQYPALDTPLTTAPDFADGLGSAALSAEDTGGIEQPSTGLGFGEGNDEFDPFRDLLDTGAAEWDLTV